MENLLYLRKVFADFIHDACLLIRIFAESRNLPQSKVVLQAFFQHGFVVRSPLRKHTTRMVEHSLLLFQFHRFAKQRDVLLPALNNTFMYVILICIPWHFDWLHGIACKVIFLHDYVVLSARPQEARKNVQLLFSRMSDLAEKLSICNVRFLVSDLIGYRVMPVLLVFFHYSLTVLNEISLLNLI